MKMTIGISMFASTAVLGAVTAWAYPFGPPNGYTSAPGDKPGIACTQCHVGSPLNGGGGSVRVSFANGLIYTPGQAQTLTVTTWDNLIVGNVFPTTVGGVTVAIDGRPAPISFVNQTQINALVPATGTLGNVSVVVSNATGSSAPATLSLSAAAPALHLLPGSGPLSRGRRSGWREQLRVPGSRRNAGQRNAIPPGEGRGFHHSLRHGVRPDHDAAEPGHGGECGLSVSALRSGYHTAAGAGHHRRPGGTTPVLRHREPRGLPGQRGSAIGLEQRRSAAEVHASERSVIAADTLHSDSVASAIQPGRESRDTPR